MSLVARLKARLGLDAAEFNRGVDDAKNKANSLGGSFSALTSRLKGGLAGLVAGVGIASTISMMRDLTRSIANVGVEARRAGLDTTAFQQLSYVAQQNRIDVDVLTDGMKELNMRVEEFVTTGGGSAAEALTRLGFKAGELARGLRKPDDLFIRIIGRMKDLDRATQLRMLDEIFGGSAGERFVELMDDGAEGVRQMMREATDLGLVMDEELIQRADELDRKFEQLTLRAANFFKAVAVGAVDAFGPVDRLANRAAEVWGEDFGDAVAGAGDDVREEVDGIAHAVLALAEELFKSSDATVTAMQAGARAASQFNAAHGASINDLAMRIVDLKQAYLTGTVGPEEFAEAMAAVTEEAQATIAEIDNLNGADLSGLVSSLTGVLSFIQRILEKAREATAEAGTVLGTITVVGDTEDPRGNTGNVMSRNAPWSAPRPGTRPTDIDFGYVPPTKPSGGGGGGGGAAQTDRFADELKAIREETQALLLETEEITGVMGSELPYALERARKAASLLSTAQEQGRELTPELRSEVEALAEAYAKAGYEAEQAAERMAQVQENSERGAAALADIFMAATKGAGNAKQAVAALLSQIAQSYILKGIMGFGASGAPGSGLVSGLGALIGANALGTSNWRGGLTAVNERGGEIMNLPRGTQIIPHDISKRMADAAGGATATAVHVTVGIDESGQLNVRQIAQREAGAMGHQVTGQMPAMIDRNQTNPRRR